jgi:pilus assembly protein Flp/PilA
MLIRREEGQGMVEYALLIVLISIAALVVLVLIGPQISTIFSQVNSALKGTAT